jgi:hypothetical protein
MIMVANGANTAKILVQFNRKGSKCFYDESLIWRTWSESIVPGIGGSSTFVKGYPSTTT